MLGYGSQMSNQRLSCAMRTRVLRKLANTSVPIENDIWNFPPQKRQLCGLSPFLGAAAIMKIRRDREAEYDEEDYDSDDDTVLY